VFSAFSVTTDAMDLVVEGDATVCVAVRMRPMSAKELREGGEVCVDVIGPKAEVVLQREGFQDKSFTFDHAFGSDSSQVQVFRSLGIQLLDKAFSGYNATIFAYGQTGSGKTHTMMADRNTGEDAGLIPRISEGLFDRTTKLASPSRKFLICCSFLEIYNEIVFDLLQPKGTAMPAGGLEIREAKGMGVYVKDLQEIVVDTAERLQHLINKGFAHRATAATQMNATSSRSHCIFTIKLHQKDDHVSANNNFSKMNLVDLAGSERASRTGAEGSTLKEGANINKSLSALGNVINSLSKLAAGNKKVFIPYRNSKLTRVLQESLGGNALTTMMAAISPAKTNCEETLSTLNYAARAKTIKLNACKNEEAEHLSKLEEEVEMLRAKLAEAEGAKIEIDTSRYQEQIAEMERFMKQTWEDKERDTQKHEEERRALEQEALRIAERANAEHQRRLKLLEDNGDLELTLQELMSLGGEAFSTWQSQITDILEKEQKVTMQCRAVAVCKDAALHDVDTWLERAQSDEADTAGDRMLLSQAEKKVASMSRELDVLTAAERQLEAAIAYFLPLLRQVAAKVKLVQDDEPKDAKQTEQEQILALMVRQMDGHRASAWNKIAEDHRNLGNFVEKIQGFLRCAQMDEKAKAPLLKEMKAFEAQSHNGPGQEACIAQGIPMGMASEHLTEKHIKVTSNAPAACCARLLGGTQKASSAFGGWTPNADTKGEYIQLDLCNSVVSGLSIQGRRPVSGSPDQTGPLLEKLLESSDPRPPGRLYKRPPVRLVHDVFMIAHARFHALDPGEPNFSPSHLDYDQLNKADRSAKVEFFDLLLSHSLAPMSETSSGSQVLDDSAPEVDCFRHPGRQEHGGEQPHAAVALLLGSSKEDGDGRGHSGYFQAGRAMGHQIYPLLQP